MSSAVVTASLLPSPAPRRRYRLTNEVLEDDLHASVANALAWHISPAAWTTFPAGSVPLPPRFAAKLTRLGLQRGWPDILILHDRLYGIELKRIGGRLSRTKIGEDAAGWLARTCRAGGRVPAPGGRRHDDRRMPLGPRGAGDTQSLGRTDAGVRMTPMAKWLAERVVAEPKWWLVNEYDKLLAPFPTVKCFEVSAVFDLAAMLADQAQEKNAIADSLAFLPAPATWLEYQMDKGQGRYGYLLVQKTETTASCVTFLANDIRGGIAFIPMPVTDLPLLSTADADDFAVDSALTIQGLGKEYLEKPAVFTEFGIPKARWDTSNVNWDEVLAAEQTRAYRLYALLSIINSPKIIDRSTHKPSSGLQKRLSRKAGKPFELLPWHEIFLDVRPPPDGEGHGSNSERLTGPKAFHFCRSFIRIRLGKLERVRAHWRGDPSLGVSQASYRVMQ